MVGFGFAALLFALLPLLVGLYCACGPVLVPAFAIYAAGIAWLLFLAALAFLMTIRQGRE